MQVFPDSMVYIPARLTMGFPSSLTNEVMTDSFLVTQFDKFRTDLFTENFGTPPDTLLQVNELDTIYIYVPAGSTVVNKDGATGDIFDMNVIPTVGVDSAVGPGYFRIVGKLGGSPLELSTGTSFDVMHGDAEIIYDPIDCFNGAVISTMTKHDQDFTLKSGDTVYVKDLNSGVVTMEVGPKKLRIEKDNQFELGNNTELCPVFWSETEADNTTFASVSTFEKDTVINGIDTFILKKEVVIDSAYHRSYFYNNVAQCNTVTLYHIDTVHPFRCESTSVISLALLPPNAAKLRRDPSNECVVVPGEPLDASKYFRFRINETKPGCTQQWFEFNFDTLACDTCWVPFNSGGILAPEPPGTPLPFVLPYSLTGAKGTRFIKAYTPNEVKIPGKDRPGGWFTVGLIVANGPPQTNSQGQAIAPECSDTVYYRNFFSILFLDPRFDIILPRGSAPKNMCVGDTGYLRIIDPIQQEISRFSLYWSVDDGTDVNLEFKQGVYDEIFHYMKPYAGPVAGRNDANIVWDPSKQWLHTFVQRKTQSYKKNTTTNKIVRYDIEDTLVSRLYRKWETRVDVSALDEEIPKAFEQLGLDVYKIDEADIPLYLGDGTFGCLDTTGIGDLFKFYFAPIEKGVVNHGPYKYQFTDSIVTINSSNDTIVTYTDSTIIEHVLHFRDTSLIGYDTVASPLAFQSIYRGDTLNYKKGDPIVDVYPLNFKYPVLIPDPCDPDPSLSTLGWEDVRGVVHMYSAVENLRGCQSAVSQDIIVGFFNQNIIAEEAVCKGSPHRIIDSIRYFTNDDINYPLTYPILPIAYWEDPARYAIKELKYVDWDADDSVIDYETSIQFSHVYDFPGTYTINYAMMDSNKCVDTIQLTAYVTGIAPNFETSLQQLGCQNIITFFDSTVVFDPCRGRDTCPDPGYDPCDSVVYYEWDFGDGSRTSFFENPSHEYTSNGWFTVKLIVRSLLGCLDSVEKQIFIPGPQPEFVINNSPWGEDSIIICVGGSVDLTNTSKEPMDDPSWIMRWGDGNISSTSDVNTLLTHVYDSVGTFYLYLYMNDNVPGVPTPCDGLFPDTSTRDGKIPREIKVIVMPITPAEFIPDDTTVCPNEPIIFTNKSDDIYTRLVWSFGDGDTITRVIATDGDTIIHTYPNPGTYKVTLEPDYDLPPGDFGPKCLDIDTGTVNVTEVVAKFEIDSTESPYFCFIDSSLNAVKWSWTIQDEDGEHFSDKQNPCYDWGERIGSWEVCLAVENSDGCTDTICKMVQNIFRTEIIPYNVFTPDGDDEMNRKFIVDVESHEEYEIKIYNRWGEKVFESTNPDDPWDGTVMNGGTLCPAGTYYYIINYKLRGREFNDGREPIEGAVTLIRGK